MLSSLLCLNAVNAAVFYAILWVAY